LDEVALALETPTLVTVGGRDENNVEAAEGETTKGS
jgi:hypothetical protein